MMGFIITACESKLWDTVKNMYTHDKNNDNCLNDVHNNDFNFVAAFWNHELLQNTLLALVSCF